MSDRKKVTCKDLGMAAYLKLQGFELYRREGRGFTFLIDQDGDEEFEATKVEYVNGPFHNFDSQIMSLKML